MSDDPFVGPRRGLLCADCTMRVWHRQEERMATMLQWKQVASVYFAAIPVAFSGEKRHMHAIFGADWHKMFSLDTPLVEIFIRGTVVYLALFALLRFVVKREVGTVGIADLLVIVVIADAAQNAMAGTYTSITDGILLICTIIGWNLTLDWLAYRIPAIRRIIEPQPVQLVKDGRTIKRNMRKVLLTEDDLMSQLRLQGCDSLSDIKASYMENDGRISVIEHEKEDQRSHRAPERQAG
jgi:uncharacterized membrane protein YcaP (DUF421 family)